MSQSIQNLNQGTPTTAAQIPYYDPTQGQDRRASLSALLALATASAGGFVTQYSAPNVNAYTTTVAPPVAGESVWLLITPDADHVAATIVLPIGANGQEVLVSCTHAVTGALTVSGTVVGAGAQPVNGAPATLVANGFFRMRFDGVFNAWYRVG